jgi:selenocysteine-specific elongation factor
MIVGTAGHIDHGKTSLVKALTGVDTDRLAEEKARGITIELGFAYLKRPSGATIGFVDVPGHERLVHTMLAGAAGIDYVLLVVAADDGIMPQTREHLAILNLLGLDRGLVVLSKCDLVDDARRAEVSAEIAAALAGTHLAGADILPVSTLTGAGLDILKARLDAARTAVPRRSAKRRFRLAVDRSFTLPGTGTVVTGTVLSGAVSVGDEVMVSPVGIAARVRSLHAQNSAAAHGTAGQRCALALVGPEISTQTVRRGDIVLDGTLHAPVRRFDAHMSVLASERKPVRQWQPCRLHHGAAEVGAHVLPLIDGVMEPGSSDYVQVVLERPLPLTASDRFVVRDASASRTIGGGVILDVRPPERHRRTPERRRQLAALGAADPIDGLARLLAEPPGFVALDDFMRDHAVLSDFADEATRSLGLIRVPTLRGEIAMLTPQGSDVLQRLVASLAEFHQREPDAPGEQRDRLRRRATPLLPPYVFEAVLERAAREGQIVIERSWARLPGHSMHLSALDENLWQRLRPLLGGAQRFRPPRVRDIAKSESVPEATVRRLFKLVRRRGEIDEVAHDHYFLAETMIEMADQVRALAAADAKGEVSVADVRDRFDNGRKVTVNILEHFDRIGLTMRRGDVRRLNPHKKDLYSAPGKG